MVEAEDRLTLTAELERKYLESLANVAAKMDMGEISQETGVTAFLAVYASVSGLVNWDDLNEIMALVNDIDPEPHIHRHFLQREREVILIEADGCWVKIARWNDPYPERRSATEYLSIGDATTEAERLVDRLTKIGWKERL